MKPLIGALLLSVLGACALFQSGDATAALQAHMRMVELYQQQADAYEKTIAASNARPEDAKRFMEAIAKARGQFIVYAGHLRSYLIESGELDYRKLWEAAKGLYDEYRSSQ